MYPAFGISCIVPCVALLYFINSIERQMQKSFLIAFALYHFELVGAFPPSGTKINASEFMQ